MEKTLRNIIFALFICISQNVQTMQKFKDATIIAAKNADSIIGYTLIGYDLIGYDVIQRIKGKKSSNITERSLEDLSYEEIGNMIRVIEILQELCPQLDVDPSTLMIHYHTNTCSDNAFATKDATGNNVIGFNSNFLKIPDDQKKATLAHELGHIKNKDPRHRAIFEATSILFAIALCYGSAVATLIVGHWAQDKLNKKGWKRCAHTVSCMQKCSCAILTSPLTHWIVSWFLIFKFSRYQEKRADLTATKLGYAHAMQKNLLRYSTEDVPRIVKSQSSFLQWLYRNDSRFFYYFYGPHHPSPEARIAYLQPYVKDIKTPITATVPALGTA